MLGMAPRLNRRLNLVPVDYVSAAMTALSMDPKALGKTFHLTHPTPLAVTELIAWINEFGFPVAEVSGRQWLEAARKAADHAPDHPLCSLLPTLGDLEQEDSTGTGDLQHFECQQTLFVLAGCGVSAPPVDKNLLFTYFAYLVRHGQLPEPKPL